MVISTTMQIDNGQSGTAETKGLALEQALAAYQDTYLASRNLAPRTRREY